MQILNGTSIASDIMKIRLRQAQLQQLIISPIWSADKNILFAMKATCRSNWAIHTLFLLSAINITIATNMYEITDWVIKGGRTSLRMDLERFGLLAVVPKLTISPNFLILFTDQILLSKTKLVSWSTFKMLQHKSTCDRMAKWYGKFKACWKESRNSEIASIDLHWLRDNL